MDSTARARAARHPEVAAGRRRRLHRPRARARVYAALGTKVTVVEMTGGLLPGADRDLVNILAQADRDDVRGGAAEHQGRRHEGGEERHRGDLRGRGRAGRRAEGADVRPRARLGRPPAELRGARARQDEGEGRTSAASSRSTGAAHRRADDLRDRRRRRRADARAQGVARRRASRSRRLPASASRSSRSRFRPWSSPIRRWPGAA